MAGTMSEEGRRQAIAVVTDCQACATMPTQEERGGMARRLMHPLFHQDGELRACPECGDIRYIKRGKEDGRCGRCRGAGHLYRMMTVKELTESIERHEREGYHVVAIKRALIRDALLRTIAA